ncbi:conserved exported hypothetical protein [Candidatus Sulfopaludibacter sp. SbA3]|nr:conserved exported hypothetical protein [Candidatus Sulfopaludibacter sp. SbA3]
MQRVILGIVISYAAMAQPPAFDVASVKLSEPVPYGQNYNINLGRVLHGEVTLTNTTLSDCVRFAYNLVSDDQIAGPEWIKSREFRYDIVAKSAPDTPRERLLQMVQTLLAERFNMQTHREPRVLAHYELVVAKGGLKMKEAQPDASSDTRFGNGSLLRVSSHRMPMFRLVILLSRNLRQAVLDKTGLTGEYDENLEWTSDDSGPSIFSAIQDQLGLKLEPHKSPVEIVVVDRADKVPVAN